MKTSHVLFSLALLGWLVVGSSALAGTITIDTFTVTPIRLTLGDSFVVRADVSAREVPVVSFVVRTREIVEREAVPLPFSFYNPQRRLAFIPEQGQVHLADNGPHDLEPEEGVFALRISTEQWRPGRYPLAFFAHNRPGTGNHIADQRNFVVTVADGTVRIEYVDPAKGPHFTECFMLPSRIDEGGKAVLSVHADTQDFKGVYLRHPYFLAPENVPPGFTYDVEKRTAHFADDEEEIVRDNGPNDADLASGQIAATLDTASWSPGLYHFAVSLLGKTGIASEERDVTLQIRAPGDRLDVTVSPSWRLFEGTHADRVTRLSDGTLLYTSRVSKDHGITWTTRESGTIGCGAQELRDGRVLGMAYRSFPIEGRSGWYRGHRFVSEDGGETILPDLVAGFHVPKAKAAFGHSYHYGPLFMRSIVERPDGSLVALMAGWFEGDDEPCPHNPRRPYSRAYTCESLDDGETWRYLSTIGYAHIGSEGYNEGSLKTLPDGNLMAVLRTGSMRDRLCQDNPIMVATSADGGKTWTKPRRTGVHGAFPDLLVLSDGTLAVSYGRPGASIMFSTDSGETWTDHTVVDATRYSGYTTICETSPGEILIIFGVKDWVDVETGERRNDIRAARVRYRPRNASVSSSPAHSPT